MTLPNFLIVGAAKSGTTSLFSYLAQHPEIYVPPVKEPSYFSDGEPNVVHTDAEYEALFERRKKEKAVGEASTPYLYDLNAPKRIADLLQNPTIFILLRNPALRAYSLWGHNFYQFGCEKLPFEEALRQEKFRIASQDFYKSWGFFYGNYHYFRSGLYYEQVKRYIDIFGKDRVHIYIFEEFVKDPGKICKEIFLSLGIDHNFLPVFEKHNVSPGYKIGFIQRFLMNPPTFLENTYQALPMILKLITYRAGKAIYLINQKHVPRPLLDARLKVELMNNYRSDIHKLEKLLGRDLSIWYSPDKVTPHHGV